MTTLAAIWGVSIVLTATIFARARRGGGEDEPPCSVINRRICPRCGPGPSGGALLPIGEPWICVHCGQVGRVAGDGILRVPTAGELFALATSPEWDEIALVERVILRRLRECHAC